MTEGLLLKAFLFAWLDKCVNEFMPAWFREISMKHRMHASYAGRFAEMATWLFFKQYIQDQPTAC